jgi:CHAT domain-containing protein
MQLPIGAIRMQGDDREVDIQPLGLTVASLRRDVVAEPGPAVVDSEAEAQLRTDTNTLGGGLADKLAELRKAGKDHLCFHPHGAFHFHPMHLIGDPGTCLADDWTVTKLAHPSLLARRDDAPATAASVPLAAFGMGFEGGQPHGLAPLPAACDEASTVSRLMQGECYLNEQATERQFIASLRAARRIHVATHGAHRVGAPVFQRVYLNPADGSDGIFHAYEVVGMDLRHVELVTLSACETALGRFDEGDNLRGLSASLLAAGVGTIVSTLWPIVDEVSQTFFIALYTALAQDPDRLAAFRTAQLATRAAFPAYRDWGAFQYLGAW